MPTVTSLPGTTPTEAAPGTVAWANLNKIVTVDGTDASVVFFATADSKTPTATDFSFGSIPASALVTAITFKFTAANSTTDTGIIKNVTRIIDNSPNYTDPSTFTMPSLGADRTATLTSGLVSHASDLPSLSITFQIEADQLLIAGIDAVSATITYELADETYQTFRDRNLRARDLIRA